MRPNGTRLSLSLECLTCEKLRTLPTIPSKRLADLEVSVVHLIRLLATLAALSNRNTFSMLPTGACNLRSTTVRKLDPVPPVPLVLLCARTNRDTVRRRLWSVRLRLLVRPPTRRDKVFNLALLMTGSGASQLFRRTVPIVPLTLWTGRDRSLVKCCVSRKAKSKVNNVRTVVPNRTLRRCRSKVLPDRLMTIWFRQLLSGVSIEAWAPLKKLPPSVTCRRCIGVRNILIRREWPRDLDGRLMHIRTWLVSLRILRKCIPGAVSAVPSRSLSILPPLETILHLAVGVSRPVTSRLARPSLRCRLRTCINAKKSTSSKASNRVGLRSTTRAWAPTL